MFAAKVAQFMFTDPVPCGTQFFSVFGSRLGWFGARSLRSWGFWGAPQVPLPSLWSQHEAAGPRRYLSLPRSLRIIIYWHRFRLMKLKFPNATICLSELWLLAIPFFWSIIVIIASFPASVLKWEGKQACSFKVVQGDFSFGSEGLIGDLQYGENLCKAMLSIEKTHTSTIKAVEPAHSKGRLMNFKNWDS